MTQQLTREGLTKSQADSLALYLKTKGYETRVGPASVNGIAEDQTFGVAFPVEAVDHVLEWERQHGL